MIKHVLDLLQITTDGKVVERKIPELKVRRDGTITSLQQWEDELHLNLLRLQDILGDDEQEHRCTVNIDTCYSCGGTGCLDDYNVLSPNELRSMIVDIENKRRWNAVPAECPDCSGSGIYLSENNLVAIEDEENLHW
jgi:hypothetical protein